MWQAAIAILVIFLPPFLLPFFSPLPSDENDALAVDYVWLGHLGVEEVRQSGCVTIELHMSNIDLTNAGQYSCNAVFNNGSNYGTVLTGIITVVGECHYSGCYTFPVTHYIATHQLLKVHDKNFLISRNAVYIQA